MISKEVIVGPQLMSPTLASMPKLMSDSSESLLAFGALF
jgi:hypothetical protein